MNNKYMCKTEGKRDRRDVGHMIGLELDFPSRARPRRVWCC